MSNNKKIALVLGQSREGCGITRYAAEMQNWGKQHDTVVDVFSYDERIYSRSKSHEIEFTSFKIPQLENIVNKINNEYDIVVFHSYPSNKFSTEAIYNFYHNFFKKINILKVGFMHELNKTNVDKIPYLIPYMNGMDTIYNFSETTWFSKNVSTLLPSKTLGTRVKKFTMMFDIDSVKSYRDSVPLENKQNKIVYCSRWTPIKDPKRVLFLHDVFRKNNSEILCELKGIERSIGTVGKIVAINIFNHPTVLDRTKYWQNRTPPHTTGVIPVYGPYVRSEGLEYMANNLFIASFYRLPKDPQGYGDRMEFSQIETIAVGSIPVFDKHWGENNRTLDGTRYIDIPYSAVYSDIDDLEATAQLLDTISKDITLQQKYIDTSYKIIKQEFDINTLMPKFIDDVVSNGFDKEKFTSEEDIIKHITNNDEFVEMYNEYNTKREVVVFGIRELTSNIFSIVCDSKEKEIHTWKKPKKIKESKKEIVTEAVDPLDDMFIYYNKKISIKNV